MFIWLVRNETEARPPDHQCMKIAEVNAGKKQIKRRNKEAKRRRHKSVRPQPHFLDCEFPGCLDGAPPSSLARLSHSPAGSIVPPPFRRTINLSSPFCSFFLLASTLLTITSSRAHAHRCTAAPHTLEPSFTTYRNGRSTNHCITPE